MKSTMSRIKTALCMAGVVLAAAGSAWAQPANPPVVIAQVYGGGGNASATYNRDFVVLFNRTAAPVDLTGWSVQYGSSTGAVGGNAGLIQALSGSIPASGYLLVAGAGATTNGVALPQIDINNTPAAPTNFPGLNLSGTTGKVALVSSVTGLNVVNPLSPLAPTLVDFVGFGTANAFEGTAAAPAPSVTTMLVRSSNGCTDTNVNSADFAAVALVAPPTSNVLSSVSATNSCSGATNPSGSNSTTATEACPTTDVTFSVTITPSNGANNAITSVVADFTSIGGSTGVALSNGGSGNVYSAVQTINLDPTGATGVGNKSIPVVITDASSRVGNASMSIFVPNCTLGLTTGTGLAFAAVCNGETQRLTVVARPARIPAATGTSTGITATADLSTFGGTSGVSLGTPTGPDANGNFTFTLDFPATFTPPFPATQAVSVTLSDAQGRTNTQNTNSTFTIITTCADAASTVVISQVYGGGGNAGAQFNADYVELFNRSGSPVDISGWSLQYFSSNDTASGKFDIPAGTSIAAGRYLLISLTPTPGGVGAAITADLTVSTAIAASSSSGRFALVRNTTQLTGTPCPAGTADVADLVAYGSPACFEGQNAAGGVSNTTAAFRANNGCTDRDQNGADFRIAAPAPRNSSTPFNNCSGTINTPPTVSAGTAIPASACSGESVAFSVIVTPGNSAITTVTANFAPIGGSTAAVLTAIAADTFAGGTTVGSVPVGPKSIIVTATDANGLTGTFSIPFTVTNCVPSSLVCCRGVTCTLVANSGNCTAPAGITPRVLDPVVTSCSGQSALNSGCCFADFNKSGVRDVADIFAFLSAWFADSPFSDVGGDGTGTRDVSDIFQFLSAWFAGCT